MPMLSLVIRIHSAATTITPNNSEMCCLTFMGWWNRHGAMLATCVSGGDQPPLTSELQVS